VWFEAYTGMQTRYALFLDITQRWVVVLCRRFWTTYRSHLQGSNFLTLEDGTYRLFRNFGTELPLSAAQCAKRVQISSHYDICDVFVRRGRRGKYQTWTLAPQSKTEPGTFQIWSKNRAYKPLLMEWSRADVWFLARGQLISLSTVHTQNGSE
jgi:hypothetical protein